jgi:hypothetical protein
VLRSLAGGFPRPRPQVGLRAGFSYRLTKKKAPAGGPRGLPMPLLLSKGALAIAAVVGVAINARGGSIRSSVSKAPRVASACALYDSNSCANGTRSAIRAAFMPIRASGGASAQDTPVRHAAHAPVPPDRNSPASLESVVTNWLGEGSKRKPRSCRGFSGGVV